MLHRRCAESSGTRRCASDAGFINFEVPEDAAEELVLVYSPNFLDSTYEIELF